MIIWEGLILPAVYSISKEIEKHCLLVSVRYEDAQNQKKALSIENARLLKRKLKQEKIDNVKEKKLATDDCIWNCKLQ